MNDDVSSGYQVVQVSALGRHPVRKLLGVTVGGLYNRPTAANQAAMDLNAKSTGERYEVEFYNGVPRE
jgi:hypothetical protein